MKIFSYILIASLFCAPLSGEPTAEKKHTQVPTAQGNLVACIIMWTAFGNSLNRWYTIRNNCKRLSVVSLDDLDKLISKRDWLFLTSLCFASLGLYEAYKVWNALGKQEQTLN